jgi:hypothetical protein
MKYGLLLVLTGFLVPLQAQSYSEKIAPPLRSFLQQRSAQERTFTLVVKDVPAFSEFLQQNRLAANMLQTCESAQIIVLKTTPTILQTQLLPSPQVLFADLFHRQPQEELAVSGLDLSLNKINLAHHFFPDINGNGLVASVKEERFDGTDIDLQNRIGSFITTSMRVTNHATTMATLLGGGGNTFYTGKGAAWGIMLTSASFANLLPDTNYNHLNIRVQNHSYGTGIENYYGAEALAYDVNTEENRYLLHVFSAGNRGNQASETGLYKGLNNVANLTGTFKMAKNVLTVGSLTPTGKVPPLSSKGPAYDGRLKPELVALGQEGSSGAAALTSGVALLLQQFFVEKYRYLPDAALTKAMLINSADDVGAPGIDFESGYGSVNAWRALQTAQERRFESGTLEKNEHKDFFINVPENVRNLKITLVWSDRPAAVNASAALVQDLDLELEKSGQIWLPWVLNAFPHPDSLRQLPRRGRDRLNNVEQITVENPTSGEYRVRVRGTDLQTSSQLFYFAWQWDSTDTLQWQFPLRNDPVEAGEPLILRWFSNLPDSTARLEYALNGGDWQTLADTVQLAQHYFSWNTPDTFVTAQLRLVTPDRSFVSDTFVITPTLQLEVGFNCDEEVLWYWQKMPDAAAYQIYQLGKTYLEPLVTTTDTFVILNKNKYPNRWYALAPVHRSGRTGLKSFTTNYTRQGVDCYLRNFVTSLTDPHTAQLQLSIGTVFNVKSIAFEKADKAGFKTLTTFTNLNRLDWQFPDANLHPGINTYRARIELENGQTVLTQSSSVYAAATQAYWLFPNPVQRGQDLFLLSQQFSGQTVRIFDALGREVTKTTLQSEVEILETTQLAAGVYQVVVLEGAKWVGQRRLVVKGER